MVDEKMVKDIMAPIEEYDKAEDSQRLCDVLGILKRNDEKIRTAGTGTYHKTVFITDSSGEIVGKVTVFDLIRGLVPEHAKKPEHSRAYYSVLTSRVREVAGEVGSFQERFQWLHTSFFDLVLQETQKKIRDVMSPVHPLLNEDDTINKAIYVIFKEDVRQPLVVRDQRIVGVVDFIRIFPVLLDIAGDECFLAL